ncbi:GNAT family N-acetyltransferase [Streptomyces sp. NPDC012794]|uniref:GNAT family N-acetyltransferase n=1 Tax=Streptomyces sp. NPDC012794 TaxID=3364850 RepID=UPI0036AA8246
MSETILAALEQYYDTVPRRGGARGEDFGPLTLFVQEGPGWQYYARPAAGGANATAEDVRAVLKRQRELKVPESFEWVAENTPSLRAAVEEAGLHVHAHPLMVLDEDAEPLPPHPEVRLLGAGDPLLRAAVTVPALAFREPGTARGTAGPAHLAAALEDPASEEHRARVSATAWCCARASTTRSATSPRSSVSAPCPPPGGRGWPSG